MFLNAFILGLKKFYKNGKYRILKLAQQMKTKIDEAHFNIFLRTVEKFRTLYEIKFRMKQNFKSNKPQKIVNQNDGLTFVGSLQKIGPTSLLILLMAR